MNSTDLDFLGSALCEGDWDGTPARFLKWFEHRREAQRCRMERIPFREMTGWEFDPVTGNLGHESGRFFKVEGAWVETNYGFKRQWSQPVINQPEIGILGILARKVDGVLQFLMQVKAEPGNLNVVQLAPTLQATRSNFTRAHKGRQPAYLEYFLEAEKHRTLVDVLQSEQGARFLRKRNRNVILEIAGEVPVLDDFCWLTLGQIHRLMQLDNVVNMCTRTVLSCISFSNSWTRRFSAHEAVEQAGAFMAPPSGSFQFRVLESELDTTHALHSNEEIITWFTGLKFRYELNVERIPLKYVHDWIVAEDHISHREEKFFSVIGVRFETRSREVASWTQPLFKQRRDGIVAFLAKEINGILHFLVQGKVEVGNFDVVEMAATIQCVTGSYRDASKNECPPFLDYVLEADPASVRYGAMQSEEGGRFFQEQNLSAVIEVDERFPLEVPPNYIWMTLAQLKQFIHYNNFVNAQARCLLSSLGLIQGRTPGAAEDKSHGMLGRQQNVVGSGTGQPCWAKPAMAESSI